MKRKTLLAGGLLLGGLSGGLLTACAPTGQRLAYPPVIEIESIRLTGLTLPAPGRAAGAAVVLGLQVDNPNPFPLRVAQLAGTLVLDGQAVGAVVVPDLRLPARGQARHEAQLSLPVTLNTATAFLKVARGQEVSYRLDGTFTADLGPLGQPSFGPFTLSQGVWKQAPLRLF